jgi:hypothetical protein
MLAPRGLGVACDLRVLVAANQRDGVKPFRRTSYASKPFPSG